MLFLFLHADGSLIGAPPRSLGEGVQNVVTAYFCKPTTQEAEFGPYATSENNVRLYSFTKSNSLRIRKG